MKIWAKTEEFSEGKYLVVRRDGTVPEWPHFVIGGFDPCAAAGLRAYAEEARRRGYDPAYCDSIVELAGDFEKLSATPRAVAIAWHLRKADPKISVRHALRMGGRILTDFLDEEGISFADPDYSWDFGGAKTLADEYEIHHWDAAS